MASKAIKIATKTAISVFKTLLKISTLGVVSTVLVGSQIPSALEKVRSEGQLHVVSRNGPTTYYEGANGYTGFEYTLAKKFAKHLGVKLVIHDSDDLGQMIEDVSNNKFHLAASGLTVTEKRQRRVAFSAPYLQITQELIYRQGDTRPRTIEDLYGKNILVIGNSSHSERLRELKREYPELSWQERGDLEMLDLLEMVHNGEIDYTIIDSNAHDINSSLYPKARVAFEISGSQDLAWAFSRHKDRSLFNEAQRFFKQIKQQGFIDDTIETYYGYLGELNYSGALSFANRVESRLPKWREELEKAAADHDLDWQLLAALSYQESHWNPKAKSPTGVRGFMMLTLNTAKDVGVKNRLNAKQSIHGGAKYYKKMLDRIPNRVAEPDKTYFALAAYNMGFGHLEDARKITEYQGGNPDKWVDVRERVLLLEKRKYYKFTKHGYARGSEATSYVRNIRNFHTIIAWNEKEKLQQLANTPVIKEQFAQLNPVITEAVKSIAVESL